jgi:probable HAF family extracellular repeat protein
MKRSSLTVARLIIATAALAFGSAHAVVPYRVTDLGPGSALSINNVGQVLGSTGGQLPRSYIFTPGSGATFLPQGFGAAGSSALNDAGLVAGTFLFPGTGQFRAALFDPARGLIDLGTLPGGGTSLAYGVNNAGQVVGEARTDLAQFRAFRWSAATGMVDLGALGGAANLMSSGRAINGAGQVTGYSARADGTFSLHAFIHDPASGLVDIDTLAGSGRSAGAAINDAGHATGEIFNLTEPFGEHAFLYKPETGMVMLVAPGGLASRGLGINAKDHIVGELIPPLGGGGLPFLYNGGPSFIDLNTVLEPTSGAGWTLEVATDINDFGQIVGIGRRDGVAHGFLLTPVPEPSTWALMLGGLALLGAAMQHRKSRSSAEAVRFELTEDSRPRRFSRPVP